MREKWIGPTAVFLAVAFVGAGALGAAQPATGLPEEVLQLTQFGPALGVLAVAAAWPRTVRRRLRPTGPTGPWAAVLLSAPALVAAAVAGTALLGGTLPVHGTTAPFALVAAAQLVGACGEEVGWRCFLQPLLRERFGVWGSSVAVGLLWGAWHVQVFTRAPGYAAGFLAATVGMSVLLGAAWERVGRHRLLLAGGFHALVNLGLLVFLDQESGAVAPMALFGAAALLVAAPWTWSVVRSNRPGSIALT